MISIKFFEKASTRENEINEFLQKNLVIRDGIIIQDNDRITVLHDGERKEQPKTIGFTKETIGEVLDHNVKEAQNRLLEAKMNMNIAESMILKTGGERKAAQPHYDKKAEAEFTMETCRTTIAALKSVYQNIQAGEFEL